MKITVITLFPEMIRAFVGESIVKRATEKGVVTIDLVDLRKFASDSYGTVDDRPYGGGAGMVLKVDVVSKALESVKESSPKIVLTTPKGTTYNQQIAERYSKLENLVILAGHYEGYDERIRSLADEEISMGDFVLTGGEIAAATIVDSVVRLLPGALKKENAAVEESYSSVAIESLVEVVGMTAEIESLVARGLKQVRLLEYPQYTRPEKFGEKTVPTILLSGDHKKIDEWRLKASYEETLKRRPDLLK